MFALVLLSAGVGAGVALRLGGVVWRTWGRLRRQRPELWVCAGVLVASCIVVGGTKRRAPPMRPARCVASVADCMAEGERGLRRDTVRTDVANDFRAPADAVVREVWRRRGAFDDWFSLASENGRFPVTNGCGAIDRLMVSAHGRVRGVSDAGDVFDFPRAFGFDLSLAPEGTSPEKGGASLFWHARTERDSLVLAWCHALSNRVAEGRVDLQLELFGSGAFEWRFADKRARWRLTHPFDRDGDGLENGVDPESDAPADEDCHGTCAAWFNALCGDLARATDVEGAVRLEWNAGVASNAYYFVSLFVDEGPAPITIEAEAPCRLPQLAVVALSGRENRVPLLIGPRYVIRSPAPFRVETMTAEGAEVTWRDENACEVRWPAEIAVSAAGGGRWQLTPFPNRIGGGYVRVEGCCASVEGTAILSDCQGCECQGCAIRGVYEYEGFGRSFDVASCACGRDDEAEGENPPPDDEEEPASVSIDLDHRAVVFENAYTNDVGEIVARRSTWIRAQVTFTAGDSPMRGSVRLNDSPNAGDRRVVMHAETRDGPARTAVACAVDARQTRTKTFWIEGVRPCGGNGLALSAQIGAANDEKSFSVYEVEVEPRIRTSDAWKNRHVVGVGEEVGFRVSPPVDFSCTAGKGETDWTRKVHQAPFQAGTYSLNFRIGDTGFQTPLKAVTPTDVIAADVPQLTCAVLDENEAGYVGMQIPLVLMPTNVGFSAIEVQEVAASNSVFNGYFATSDWEQWRYHDRKVGAGKWSEINPSVLMDVATIDFCAQPWMNGQLSYIIPLAWRKAKDANSPETVFATKIQSITITPDGVVTVHKYGYAVRRVRNEDPQLYRSR